MTELNAELRPFGGLDVAPLANQMREIAARLPSERKRLADCREDFVNTLFGGQCSADEFRVKSSEDEFNRLAQLITLRHSVILKQRNKYRPC